MKLIHADFKTLTQNKDIADFILIQYFKDRINQITTSNVLRNVDARPLREIQDDKPILDKETLEALGKIK